jgi:phosphate transport system permease protein
VNHDAIRRWKSTIVVWLCGLSVLVALVPLAFILFFVVSQGVQALNWDFFTKLPAPVGEPGGGFANAIVGTLLLVGIGAAFAVPIGVISGVYIAEFPATKLATMARFAADTLNGVPSIVVGVFVYGIAVSLRHRGDAVPAVQRLCRRHRARHHDDPDRDADDRGAAQAGAAGPT